MQATSQECRHELSRLESRIAMLVERAGYLGIDAADLPEVTESNTGGAAKQPNVFQIMGWRMKEASRAKNQEKGVTDELPIGQRIENLLEQRNWVGNRAGVMQDRETQNKANQADYHNRLAQAKNRRLETGGKTGLVVPEADDGASKVNHAWIAPTNEIWKGFKPGNSPVLKAFKVGVDNMIEWLSAPLRCASDLQKLVTTALSSGNLKGDDLDRFTQAVLKTFAQVEQNGGLSTKDKESVKKMMQDVITTVSEVKQFASEVKPFAAVPRNQGFKTVQGIVGTFTTLSAGKSPEKVAALVEFTKNELRSLLATGDEKTERAVNQSIKMLDAVAGGSLSTSSKEAEQVKTMLNEFHSDLVESDNQRGLAKLAKVRLDSFQMMANINTELSAGAKEHLDRVIQQGLNSIEPYLPLEKLTTIMGKLESSSKREDQTTADFVKPFQQQLKDLQESVDAAKSLPPGDRQEIEQAINAAHATINTLSAADVKKTGDMLTAVNLIFHQFTKDVQDKNGNVLDLVKTARARYNGMIDRLESEDNTITGVESKAIGDSIMNGLKELDRIEAEQMDDLL
ncbi:hypothetical protein COB21_06095 [Candidatus Aerophobetes bacterium]|uniref:Uncharacterized protein n=1 Tax=Aerophobetes bacterium TaxID=2030807 RepID=A0A2A4WXM0_UNCAE|nr:MAG: hypothetical protein COB21_06095 [Candidatus Aerophobetes bacterium]